MIFFLQYILIKVSILIIVTLLWLGIMKDKYNILYLFIYFELLLLTGITIFTLQYVLVTNLYSLIFFTFSISLAAIKAAIGLSLIIVWVKHWNTLNIFN